ncbi:MAG: sensor histidine kinase [Planctomycetota bacterium]|jgi:signal transduction histidine kinase
MSFRVRLLLVIVLVNLGVLGIVQLTTHVLQAPARQQERRAYQRVLEQQYQRALAAAYELAHEEAALAVEKVRYLLSVDVFATQFADMHVIHGEPLTIGSLALNPLGESMRSDQDFDVAAVQAGIRESVRENKLLEVGSGFCVPIVVDDTVVAGAWARPLYPSEPTLPLSVFILPILVSIVMFALLANWIVTRTIGRHMQTLGETARRLARADYSARVPRLGTSPEINVLAETFNVMAAKVAGHTEELAREVQRATEEAKSKERALVVSARLASMGTLAAGIAHEINNPIGGMLNAVQYLGKREDLSERDRHYLRLIQDGLERVGRTARKMLDFRPRQIEAVDFPLADALERARALVEHRLQRQQVLLTQKLPPDLPALYGEPYEIQQVFLNLFLNSLDVLAGQEGGRIDVVGEPLGDDRVCIRVTDNGPGADQLTLQRAMDPFFSSKDAPDASGLGLSICFSIIRNHRGEMTLESQPGHGFEVTIVLPVAAAAG